MERFANLDQEGEGAFKAWACTALTHRFVDHCRRRRTEVMGLPGLRVVQEEGGPTEGEAPGPWKTCSEEQLRAALLRLKRNHREPYELRVAGFRYKEIAQRLRAPEATVGHWIFLARQELKELLLAGASREAGVFEAGMNELCYKLHLFVDDELPPIDAENFRHHLAHCGRCMARLEEVLQLDLLAARAQVRPVESLAAKLRASRWRPLWTVAAVAVLAAWLWVLLWVTSLPEVSPEVWLAEAPSRSIEARVSYSAADLYHRYNPSKGTDSGTEAMPPLKQLARLEERGDMRGIAAAYLVRGDWRQAAVYLARTPPSPDRANDLAVVAMKEGRLEEALGLLKGVLEARPKHPQALWNLGLVLSDLGQTHRAEDVFDQVAGLREPGWSEEARARVASLRQQRRGPVIGSETHPEPGSPVVAPGASRAPGPVLRRHPRPAGPFPRYWPHPPLPGAAAPAPRRCR